MVRNAKHFLPRYKTEKQPVSELLRQIWDRLTLSSRWYSSLDFPKGEMPQTKAHHFVGFSFKLGERSGTSTSTRIWKRKHTECEPAADFVHRSGI